MTRLVDLTGKVFGDFLVIKRVHKTHGQVYYDCVSKCCNISKIYNANKIKHQAMVCIKCKPIIRNKRSNTLASSKVYKRWDSIKQRCLNPRCKDYHKYGGRGIKLHQPWISDFRLFEKYIIDNLGLPEDGLSLDRINNDGNYEPGNLRWATPKQQQDNRRDTVFKYKYKHRFGVTLNSKELSELTGIRYKILYHDYCRGIDQVSDIIDKANRLGHIKCFL